MRISRGGGGRGYGHLHPLGNHKSIGFLSSTGLVPLENHKVTQPLFHIGSLSARQ